MKSRFLLTILFASLSVVSLTSCSSSDGNEGSLDNYLIDIATIDSLSPNSYSLLLDNGLKLWPASSADNSYNPRQHQRVFINYSILSDKQGAYDHYVRINRINEILTKNTLPLTASNNDSLGNDPMKVESIWSGGGFLNVEFSFWGSGSKVHSINLVTVQEESPVSGVVYMELRHNAFKDSPSQHFYSFACFNLKPLMGEGSDSVKLIIRVNEPEGTGLKQYEIN